MKENDKRNNFNAGRCNASSGRGWQGDERNLRRHAQYLGVPHYLIRMVGLRQASRLAGGSLPENGYD